MDQGNFKIFFSNFLFLKRPSMNVYSFDQGEKIFLGTIDNPFTCCDYEINVNNDENYRIFTLKPENSCGMYCCCPMESCSILNFDIYDYSMRKIEKIEKVIFFFLLLKKTKFCENNCN